MGEPRPKRRRRWIIVLCLLLAAAGVGEWVASRAIARKIHALVEKKLDAELFLGTVYYIPPFSAYIGESYLVRKDRELLRVDSINVSLTRLPLGDSPIVISDLFVDGPTAALEADLFQDIVKESGREHEPRKLSEMLQLKRVKFLGGRMAFRDAKRRDSPPTVWSRLDVNAEMLQRSPSQYTFHIVSKATSLADASVGGMLDVDTLELDVHNLTMKMRAEPEPLRSPLPTLVQDLIRDYRVTGMLSISGSGRMPLRDPQQSAFSLLVKLRDSSMQLPGGGGAMLDHARGIFRCTKSAGGPVAVAMENIDVAGVGKHLFIDSAQAEIDGEAGTWKLSEVKGNLLMLRPSPEPPEDSIPLDKFAPAGRIDFTAAASGPLELDGADPWTAIEHEVIAYPRDVSYRPKNFAHRIESINGGEVRLSRGTIVFQELNAQYGSDELRLRSARLPVATLPNVINWREISGSVTFAAPLRRYSPNLDKVLDTLNPEGTFLIAGSHTTDKTSGERERDYDLIISSDTGSFTVSPRRITLGRIRGDATVTPEGVEVHGAEAEVLGGTVQAGGHWLRGQTPSYDADLIVRDMDLSALEERLRDQPPRKPLKGRVTARASIFGALPPNATGSAKLRTLRGDGQVEVVGGAFFEIPLLKVIAQNVGLKEAVTVGDAAAVFDIEDGQIRLRDAAINSPALGLQGGGAIGLDGRLDLNVVVAPLADWRDKMRETRIPVVSNVAGEIVGGIQKMLNAATGTLLYQFRVGGTTDNVRLTAVAAPVLSDAAAFVFGRMLVPPKKEQRPLDLLEHDDRSRAQTP